MKYTNWIHTIIRAMLKLGGDAPYSLLKPKIEMSGERELTPKWHQTVEGTIEQFSSDSIRGTKPPNFAGSSRDVFRKIGHGHWGIRDYKNQFVLQSLEQIKIGSSGGKKVVPEIELASTEEKPVFVREHWRALPGDRALDELSFQIEVRHLVPSEAWVSIEHLHVRFVNKLEIQFPLDWFPMLFGLSKSQRAEVEVIAEGLHWRSSRYLLTSYDLLFVLGEH